MTLSKPVKILVGIGTAWLMVFPVLLGVGWLLMSFGMVAVPILLRDRFPLVAIPLFFILFIIVFAVQFATVAVQMALMVFYLVHVIKNTAASETIRIILAIGNFFIPFASMPIYYYLFIWRDRPPEWALNPVPLPAYPQSSRGGE